MKRKRDSRWKGKREVDEPEIQPFLPSFADLPSPITTNILLGLPIKSVLICKCVCKAWHTIISDPHFAKLHFKHAPADVMIRTRDPKRVSRTLHLLEFQPKNFIGSLDHDNWDRFCRCDDFCKPNCNGHVKFEAKFKLPLRDAKMVLDKMLEAKNNCSRKRSYISCKPKDDKFAVVNSCKGLLCLCDSMDRNSLVVCNPVTGEFIRLRETSKIFGRTLHCGLGYDEKTREFKVIRVNGMDAEMHTLGTGTWKSVGIGSNPYGLRFPTSVNGALHWLRPLPSSEEFIVRFNFELQRFENFPFPLSLVDNHGVLKLYQMTIGELNGCLYLCGISDSHCINLWLMKKYGVRDSWTKIYEIDMNTDECWPIGSYRPIKLFSEGAAILMYNSFNCLIYHERGGSGFQLFRIRGTQFKFEAFVHIPSLISLKDAVKGDHVQVQNVHSRCAAFKLREEKDILFLAEEKC